MHDQAPTARPGSATQLTVRVTPGEGHTLVQVAGEVDLGSAPGLRARLHELVVEGEVHLVVDLSGVSFMDSMGLGVLVGVYKQVRMFRGSLVLVAPARQVRRILEVTALDRVFRICADLDEAIG